MFIRAFVLILCLAGVALAAPTTAEPPRPRVLSTPTPAPKYKKRPVAKTPAQLVAEYMPKVKAALAARWAGAVTPRMSEFTPGNLSLSFKLDADGNVTCVTVADNTSNAPFAKFCDQFLHETKFDPPPARALADGQIEIPFTFTIY